MDKDYELLCVSQVCALGYDYNNNNNTDNNNSTNIYIYRINWLNQYAWLN